MITTKTIDVFRDDETKCTHLVLNAYIDEDGEYGVQLIAWHEHEETWLIQHDFIPMDFDHIHSFIRDYSGVSAQDFVHRFIP